VSAWAVTGLGAGALHVWLLWRRVQGRRAWTWLRLPLVVAGLLLAAQGGGLVAAALGWALGFGAGAVALQGRRVR
jgi:hypothetical protein